MTDLPVAVDLPGALGQEVANWVEEAGWQLVDLDGPPPPVLSLVAAPRPGRCSVVVCEGAPAPDQVRAALLEGALDVVAWPADRGRLLEAPLRVPATAAPASPVARFTIGGVAGGAGTSTVALAVGALAAWSGSEALVIGGDGLLSLCGSGAWEGPGAAELAQLAPEEAAAEVPALTRPVPGVGRLHVLGGARDGAIDVSPWPFRFVVLDAGSGAKTGAELLVARPDSTLRSAPAGPVVVVGDRPLGRAAAQRELGREPAGWLPWSARVARAGLHGTVPSALPGSWLKALRAVLARSRP